MDAKCRKQASETTQQRAEDQYGNPFLHSGRRRDFLDGMHQTRSKSNCPVADSPEVCYAYVSSVHEPICSAMPRRYLSFAIFVILLAPPALAQSGRGDRISGPEF